MMKLNEIDFLGSIELSNLRFTNFKELFKLIVRIGVEIDWLNVFEWFLEKKLAIWLLKTSKQLLDEYPTEGFELEVWYSLVLRVVGSFPNLN